MVSLPSLPLPVRIYNGVRRLASRVGVPVGRLDANTLMQRARTNTGLSDFGPDTFREPLEHLIASLEADAGLTALGYDIAAQQLTGALENRLRLNECIAREPEITRGEITRPVFIVGMPRTGTSILHELVAQDPNVRVPLTWEVTSPTPPPETASYASDPRIRECNESLAGTDRLIPGFRKMHRMDAQLPQEDVSMTSLEFTSMLYEASFRLPSYTAWFHRDADMRPAYRLHRRFLQVLQWRCPADRWILKTPGHLWALDSLLAEYPDACLIQTHRDPLQIVSSLTSLLTTLRALASDRVDPHDIAREWSELNAQAYDASIEARESGLIAPDQVIDIHFHDFMADPFAQIQRIYAKFGLDYT
ncbi:MAG: sulfotransferase, partial [Myxococcota bacterium]